MLSVERGRAGLLAAITFCCLSPKPPPAVEAAAAAVAEAVATGATAAVASGDNIHSSRTRRSELEPAAALRLQQLVLVRRCCCCCCCKWHAASACSGLAEASATLGPLLWADLRARGGHEVVHSNLEERKRSRRVGGRGGCRYQPKHQRDRGGKGCLDPGRVRGLCRCGGTWGDALVPAWLVRAGPGPPKQQQQQQQQQHKRWQRWRWQV